MYALEIGDAQHLAGSGGGCAGVRDVQRAVRAKSHTGWHSQPGDHVFNDALTVDADDFALTRCRVAGRLRIAMRIGQFQNVQQAVRSELQRDNGGETAREPASRNLLRSAALVSNPGVVSKKLTSLESVTTRAVY